MNIYFAGSIRGGREDQERYARIIELLKRYGTVLTEHVGKVNLPASEFRAGRGDVQIYKSDMAKLRRADAVVAEVSTPSIGVGYEIGAAEALGKPILCLYHIGSPKKISAMISGNERLKVVYYREIEELSAVLERFLQS